MNLEVVFGNIVDAKTDAILNCANSNLEKDEDVCGEIFKSAGIKDLEKECKRIGYCKVGDAVLTNGYNLFSKYIIHAVGPNYYGREEDFYLLEQAYINALRLADRYDIKSLSLCSISPEIYGFPLDMAIPIALKAIHNYEPKSLEKCYVYCNDKMTYDSFYNLEQEYRKTHNPLNQIPTKVFVDFVKDNSKIHKTDEELKKYVINNEKQFGLMHTVKWEHFENLSKEELERIPLGWIYDWMHVCGGYNYQDKIQELYKKYGLSTNFNSYFYLKKYDKLN